MPDLQERYEQVRDRDSDIQAHLPRFVALVEELNAQHVIELGTRGGNSTIAWLYALEKTGGRLTTVDLQPAPNLGDNPGWTHIVGGDLEPDVLARMWSADIVFIDTSHHYQHTLDELEAYLPFASKRILLHDTGLESPHAAPEGDPPFPVRCAVSDFCDRHCLEWSEHRDSWGLATILTHQSARTPRTD